MGNRVIYIPTNDVEKPQQRCVLYFGNQRSVVFERIYEEYEWLVGDADAYINTLNNYHPYEDSVSMLFRDNLYPNRESKYNKYNAEEQIWGACIQNTNLVVRSYISGTGYDSTNKICNNVIDKSTADSAVDWGRYAVRSFINDSPEHSLYISSVDANTDKYYFIYNGDTKGNLSTRYTLPEIINQNVYVFYANQVTNGYFNGSFAYFIHYRNGDEIIHLVPCKLLQPIPAILDGNGIARQAGECGMWDKVSGRFYGNVANSGTFTVKNPKCYEEYNWLIDNRIDGNYAYMYGIEYDLWNNHLQMMIGQTSGGSNRFFAYNDGNNCAFQMYRDNSTNKLNVIFRESSGTQHIADVSPYSEMADGVEFDFYIENALSYCKRNGVIYTNNGSPTCTQSNWTSILPTIYSARMGYIREVLPNGSYKSNLVPCKLTHGIPASMDANGIARPAGTCGMWDKVSNRFYGNVNNSGSFIVSN